MTIVVSRPTKTKRVPSTAQILTILAKRKVCARVTLPDGTIIDLTADQSLPPIVPVNPFDRPLVHGRDPA